MVFPLVIPVFVAGIVTFFAPCTLPLLPAYLTFMGGVSLEAVSHAHARRKIIVNGIFFIVGFSAVFIVFGASVGFIGHTLTSYRVWLERISGVIVILFGLMMIGVINLPLVGERSIHIPRFFKNGTGLNSFSLGASFAFGWTPCIGPIVGSVLLLASNVATVWQGILLLAVFSLGFAVPFLFLALGISHFLIFITKIQPYLNWAAMIGGGVFIGLGILLITNKIELLNSFEYQFFYFLPFERFLNYL